MFFSSITPPHLIIKTHLLYNQILGTSRQLSHNFHVFRIEKVFKVVDNDNKFLYYVYNLIVTVKRNSRFIRSIERKSPVEGFRPNVIRTRLGVFEGSNSKGHPLM